MLEYLLHLLPAEFGARNLRQCVHGQAYRGVAGRRGEQRAKLAFRRVECRVGHVVDEADVDTVRIGLVECRHVSRALRPIECRNT